MSRAARSPALVAVAALLFLLPAAAEAKPRFGSFKQIRHELLMERGMNVAIAIHGDYAYIGCGHPGLPHGGILVVGHLQADQHRPLVRHLGRRRAPAGAPLPWRLRRSRARRLESLVAVENAAFLRDATRDVG